MKNVSSKKNEIKDFKRIIVPVDGSKYSEKAAKKAFALAKKTGINVLAIYVLENPIVYPEIAGLYPELIESSKKYGLSILNKIEKMGSKFGIHVITKLVEGHPDQEIIKEASKNDLIIMGCKGRSGLSSILVGSVCEKVFRHSSSPVLVVR
jgi:nucleotide-binding universal stress UspA family protein